jgi:hypothetical protein
MAQNETSNQRQVIVKVLTVTKNPDEVFRFFSNVKNMEIGNAIKSVTKRKVGKDDYVVFLYPLFEISQEDNS